METKKITILGIGCTLLSDQGFGVSVIQALNEGFDFPEHVRLVDGGLVGVGLTGTLAQTDYLIVVDVITNNGHPGDIYRLEDRQIFERLTTRNHVQQVEFLEALAHCQALDHPSQTVLLGIEPGDTKTLACELTPVLQEKVAPMTALVLKELDRLAVTYRKGEKNTHVSSHSIKNNQN
jgi:hydrogenase maturation protease